MCLFFYRWRPVQADEKTDFQYLDQEVYTNSSTTSHDLTMLQPYTVYSFKISALNSVGRSKPSRNSYPAITLRESKIIFFQICFLQKQRWEFFKLCQNNNKQIWTSKFHYLFIQYFIRNNDISILSRTQVCCWFSVGTCKDINNICGLYKTTQKTDCHFSRLAWCGATEWVRDLDKSNSVNLVMMVWI